MSATPSSSEATNGPVMPEVPPTAEASLPGFELEAWVGLFAPAGTPQPIIDKMRKALQEVLGRESVRTRLAAVGAVANLSTPEEFREAIASDIKSFQEVAKKAGLEAN